MTYVSGYYQSSCSISLEGKLIILLCNMPQRLPQEKLLGNTGGIGCANDILNNHLLPNVICR